MERTHEFDAGTALNAKEWIVNIRDAIKSNVASEQKVLDEIEKRQRAKARLLFSPFFLCVMYFDLLARSHVSGDLRANKRTLPCLHYKNISWGSFQAKMFKTKRR